MKVTSASLTLGSSTFSAQVIDFDSYGTESASVSLDGKSVSAIKVYGIESNK